MKKTQERVWEAADAASYTPNRKQRRDHARLNFIRPVRRNIVGFGLWRKPSRWHARREMFKEYE